MIVGGIFFVDVLDGHEQVNENVCLLERWRKKDFETITVSMACGSVGVIRRQERGAA